MDGATYSNVGFWAIRMDRDHEVRSTADTTMKSTGNPSALTHDLQLTMGHPGFVAGTGIPRQQLLNAGHTLQDFTVNCKENDRPGHSQVSLGGGQDEAGGTGTLDLPALQPTHMPGVDSNGSGAAPPEAATSPALAPGPTAVVALAAVVLGFVLFTTRRPS